MSEEVRDFDAFWAEKEEAEGKPATIAVRFGGREYEVPASPSAPVLLRVARLSREGTDTVGMDDVLIMAEGILGRGVVEAISSADPGLSAEKLMGFLQWVGELQTGTVPNRETRRANRRSTSSKPGASSRRTSSASTGSTFASS